MCIRFWALVHFKSIMANINLAWLMVVLNNWWHTLIWEYIYTLWCTEFTVEISKEALKCFAYKEELLSSQSRAHLAVSTEWVLSQTNRSCLCESSSPFTVGSLYDYVIHISLFATSHVSLITSFQPPLASAKHLPPPLKLPPCSWETPRDSHTCLEVVVMEFFKT